MKSAFLACISAAVLILILVLGLRPFHAPRNDVTWLESRPGLAFGRNSAVLTSGRFRMAVLEKQSGASVEIWMQPAEIWVKRTFLASSDSGNPFQLRFRQHEMDLEIRMTNATFRASRVFRRTAPIFLTMASGANGTSVYVDGSLLRTIPELRLSAEDFMGRLVLGDSPGQSDSWQGRLFGLAIYCRELRSAEVKRHYQSWTQQGRPEIAGDEGNPALYLFREGSGNVAHNAVASSVDLQIPAKYTVVDKIFLEPIWEEFRRDENYWRSALQNVIGFIPLGFCFYGWLTALRFKRAGIVTVIFGTGVSLTIEILQAYLPTRDSGTTDIVTNTLGTLIGVVVSRVLGDAARVLFARSWRPADRKV